MRERFAQKLASLSLLQEQNVYSPGAPRLAAPLGAGCKLDRKAHCAPMERAMFSGPGL